MRFEDIKVEGGALHVAIWDGAPGTSGAPVPPVVIAAHGITATHASWYPIARELHGSVTFIAPDLRGRGGSNGIEGPFGIHAHAADLVAIMDQLDIAEATLVGHSMGGFIAAVAGHVSASRFPSIVVMDGGIRMVVPPEGVPVETVTANLVGPSIDRLSMTFPTRDAYHDFWRAHPGLTAEGWNDDVTRYVDYDLVPCSEGFRSGVQAEAVFRDAKDTLVDELSIQGIYSLTQPLTFLGAERGFLDDAAIYSDAQLDELRARAPHAQIERLDTNHFMLGLGRASAVVADRIRKAAGV